MDEKERKGYDFYSILPPALQNKIEAQNRLIREGKEPFGRTEGERYFYGRWL